MRKHEQLITFILRRREDPVLCSPCVIMILSRLCQYSSTIIIAVGAADDDDILDDDGNDDESHTSFVPHIQCAAVHLSVCPVHLSALPHLQTVSVHVSVRLSVRRCVGTSVRPCSRSSVETNVVWCEWVSRSS